MCHLSNPAAARRRSDARPATLSPPGRLAGLPTFTIPVAAGTMKPCPFPDTAVHRTCRGGACMHVDRPWCYIFVSFGHPQTASASYRHNSVESTISWAGE